MQLRYLAAATSAILSLALAGAALADEAVTVKLATPVAAKTRLVAGGAVFLCEADACQAAAPSSRTFAASTCRELARSVGQIQAFGSERKQFDAEKLGQCNAAATASTEVAKR